MGSLLPKTNLLSNSGTIWHPVLSEPVDTKVLVGFQDKGAFFKISHNVSAQHKNMTLWHTVLGLENIVEEKLYLSDVMKQRNANSEHVATIVTD